MIYKHKQLSTKLVGADFSAPRASFPACTEPHPELVEGRSKPAYAETACAEPVEASKHRMSKHPSLSKCHCIKMSNLQIIKMSPCQNVKFSNRQIFKSSNN